jgi:hypothetical protein
MEYIVKGEMKFILIIGLRMRNEKNILNRWSSGNYGGPSLSGWLALSISSLGEPPPGDHT